MPDFDQALFRLRTLPVPAGLAEINAAVFAGLARSHREAAAAPRLTGFAVAAALVMGMVAGGFSSSEPAVAQPISPFASDNPLAPSTLLAVHP